MYKKRNFHLVNRLLEIASICFPVHMNKPKARLSSRGSQTLTGNMLTSMKLSHMILSQMTLTNNIFTHKDIHQYGHSPIQIFTHKYVPPYETFTHQSLSKYLTAQDTHFSPTITKRCRNMSSHGNLLSLQAQSTIQETKAFCWT